MANTVLIKGTKMGVFLNIKTFRSIVLFSTLAFLVNVLIASNNMAQEVTSESTSKVVLTSEVKWEHLNPARGDKSPSAGTLWGDRNGTGPTGFLLRPTDGFESPPHIHNVSYRGVVISGLIHNDDPDAANMWMPAGSFWTQPQGEVHITAAKGSNTLAYIEIDRGPYLVLPAEKAFDNGERPVNVDASNIVWIDASNITWIEQAGISDNVNGPKVAFLWGKPEGDHLNGRLIKLPAGFSGEIISHGSTLHGVVIKGQLQYNMSETEIKILDPGSYFSSVGESTHQVNSNTGEENVIYIRTNGKMEVIPNQHKE